MEWSATKVLLHALRPGGVLTLATLLIAWQSNTPTDLLLAVPFILLVYTLYFSIGSEAVASSLRRWCGERLLRWLMVPLALVLLLFLYLFLTGYQPWRGNSWLIPLMFAAPVLFYRWQAGSEKAVSWRDVIGIILCFMPYIWHDYPFNSALPSGGGGIENLYLTLAIIVAVYSLVVVRRIERVGFVPRFTTDAMKVVFGGWASFMAAAVAIGVPGGLLRWVGYEPLNQALLLGALAHFLRTLFGTALPEELLFRGVMMNLLQQRLEQSGQWQRYLSGSLLLLPLAAVAGYIIDDQTRWFPLLCVLMLLLLTHWFNHRQSDHAAMHTALLIVSILFGLAHYHIHNALFMGLAMIAGWVYGYVYNRTGNVFCSALTHALVNTSPALFGLALVR